MAKTHEEEKSHRTLTPEEQARRKATLEGGDPLKATLAPTQTSEYGGPRESYERRLERAALVANPMAIDYDRDGYPDAIVGRASRNFKQLAKAANTDPKAEREAAMMLRTGRGATFTVGVDGHRQDQVGYRDRLRARIAAQLEVEEAEGEPVDPEVQALADIHVPSHCSSGVPGGLPSPAVAEPEEPPVAPEAVKKSYTPLEQAIMAPATPRTGFTNKEAARAIPANLVTRKVRDMTEGEEGGEPPPPSGLEGPYGSVRRSSFGSVPVQGTVQEDGSFLVAGPATEEEAPPEEGKTKHKAPEHAKGHEHTKAHEPAKAHEHTKQPEHHGKK